MRVTHPALAALAVASAAIILGACAPRVAPDRGAAPSPRRGPVIGSLQMSAVYRDNGLLVGTDPMPFVGSVRYLAGASPDSTLVLVTASFANQILTFDSDGQSRRGRYAISTQLRRDGSPVVRVDASETVRVGSAREAARLDESVIFQQFFHAAPGDYALTMALRDGGSARSSIAEMNISVPPFVGRSLATPIVVFEGQPRATRDSLPLLVANPRSTGVIGRDAVLPIYLEGYGIDSTTRIEVSALDERRRPLWRDTVAVAVAGDVGSAVVEMPVSRVGVGRHTVTATLIGGGPRRSAISVPVFVSFGEGVAIGSFDEMLSFLRYFASEDRLAPLRDTVPERRAAAWARFLRETDPDPSTPEHEGLRAYFNRIQIANQRFGDDIPGGWLSDRGKVFVTLGEPDQVLQSVDAAVGRRNRSQGWRYDRLSLQLVFVDRTGMGRWELTPSSEFDFQSAVRRERQRQDEARPLGSRVTGSS